MQEPRKARGVGKRLKGLFHNSANLLAVLFRAGRVARALPAQKTPRRLRQCIHETDH